MHEGSDQRHQEERRRRGQSGPARGMKRVISGKSSTRPTMPMREEGQGDRDQHGSAECDVAQLVQGESSRQEASRPPRPFRKGGARPAMVAQRTFGLGARQMLCYSLRSSEAWMHSCGFRAQRAGARFADTLRSQGTSSAPFPARRRASLPRGDLRLPRRRRIRSRSTDRSRSATWRATRLRCSTISGFEPHAGSSGRSMGGMIAQELALLASVAGRTPGAGVDQRTRRRPPARGLPALGRAWPRRA